MSMKETLIQARDTARMEKDTHTLNAVNFMIGAIEQREFTKEGRVELDDTQAVAVLRTVYKALAEPAIALVGTIADGAVKEEAMKLVNGEAQNVPQAVLDALGERAEQFTSILRELVLVNSYLPQLLSAEETEKLVSDAVANGASNIGQVMGALKKYNNLDKKLASNLARKYLS